MYCSREYQLTVKLSSNRYLHEKLKKNIQINQVLMEKADIKKTTFRAGSSGLYKCTHLPFGLSNLGSSFCNVMEMCLSDQKFVTLLLYLGGIYVFATGIYEVLDHLELLFKTWKEFNLKIKPKKYHFFVGYVLSADGISANLNRIDKVKNYLMPTNQRELNLFLALESYYFWFIQFIEFTAIANYLHELDDPNNVKKNQKGKPMADPQEQPPKFKCTDKHQ